MIRLKQLGVLAAAIFGLSGIASAQTITFSAPTPAEVEQGTAANGVTVIVSYTAGSDVGGYQLDVAYPVEFTNMASSSGRCSVDSPAANRIRVLDIDTVDGNPLPSSGPGGICTLTFDVANTVAVGNYSFTVCNAAPCEAPQANSDVLGTNDPETLNTDLGNAVFTVTAGPTPPTIDDGVYTDGGASGTEGVVTQIGNIAFNISAPAASGGSGSIVCTDAAGGPNFSFSPAGSIPVVGGTSSPVNVAVSCPLSPFGGGAVTGDVTCNIVDSANPAAPGRTQTISNVSCPEGAEATGPILTPPAVTDINVGTGIVGGPGSGSIVFTAAGGDPGQVTALNCSVDSGPVTVSPLTQNVMTGATSASVTVSVPLTVAPQPDVGQVTCNGTSFSISAPAGLTGPPLTIPASSLWSQLALIALFLGLGGLIMVRRNG